MPLLQQLLKLNYCRSCGVYSHVIQGKKYTNLMKKNTNGIPLNFAERQEGLFLIEKGSLTVQRGSNWVNPQTEDTETSVRGRSNQFNRMPFAFRKIKAATSVRPPFLPHFRSKHSSSDIFTHALVIPGSR